ncbi:coiled-coil domain-containing protein 13 isoform X1 [Petromyzon marinus]|uniref:Coiled-coil domain-containing protein 13 isoform X1 n=1 Tax=Petromyzon marinus TaxID=7757 RepID=A0AAJ7TVL8_PETMA|nr:coiled-coil domain-containing protein 13 isoform X1 [Petromyzon marinus]XP_032823830.1 coiled-coil domain-containing protein 13 isoform X1 [Petromyzon marinus]
MDEALGERLRLQLATLQQQQRARLERLRERRGDHADHEDLGLELTAPADPGPSSGGKDEAVRSLQERVREMGDELSRLHRIVAEKDRRAAQLQSQLEESRLALAGPVGASGDTAALKIVELSKRVREMTAELERERSRVKQLTTKLRQLEEQRQEFDSDKRQGTGSGTHGKDILKSVDAKFGAGNEEKALQDKLSATNLKLSDYRNQVQLLKQELRTAHKVLTNEVGETVNIPHLLSNPGSWRGRSQQILNLQTKVRELEAQLGQSTQRSRGSELLLEEEEMTGNGGPRRTPLQDKNQAHIRAMERERKEAMEKMAGELETLRKEQDEGRRKLEGTRARNIVLTTEVKTLRGQISTLMVKAQNDDELIQTLLEQQKRLQDLLKSSADDAAKQGKEKRVVRVGQAMDVQNQGQQQFHMQAGNTLSQLGGYSPKSQGNLPDLEQPGGAVQADNTFVRQLQEMVSEKEVKIKQLEQEIQHMVRKVGLNRLAAEGTGDEAAPFHLGSSQGSARMVSKMGHTLVEASPMTVTSGGATRPSSSSIREETELLRRQCVELRALSQTAQVERDRLMELVGVLQQRVEEATDKAREAEVKHQESRRRAVELEQQLGRARMEAGSKMRAGQISRRSIQLTDKKDSSSSALPSDARIPELETQLAIQQDENEALKMALQSTLHAKEEDLRLYNQMMEQSKEIFLQALWQERQQTGGRSSSGK